MSQMDIHAPKTRDFTRTRLQARLAARVAAEELRALRRLRATLVGRLRRLRSVARLIRPCERLRGLRDQRARQHRLGDRHGEEGGDADFPGRPPAARAHLLARTARSCSSAPPTRTPCRSSIRRPGKVLHDLPSGEDPEQFALSPDGQQLFIANEDDAAHHGGGHRDPQGACRRSTSASSPRAWR